MTECYLLPKRRSKTRFAASTSALTAAIMACGLTAEAQTNNVATNAPAQLPQVTVQGQQGSTYKPDAPALPKFTAPIRDTPQTLTVVPKKVMEDQGAYSLRDALRNVAGISMAAGEGGSQGDNLTIRGFSARNDLYLDGMRDFGSYYRDGFNVEQVDVLKGPASVAFGRGSTGGIINEESKMPGLKPSVQGSLALGTDMTRRATVDWNEPIKQGLGEGAAFRLNLMGQESNVANRDEAKVRRWGVAPSLVIGLGTPTRWNFNYYHITESDIPDYGIPFLFNRPAPVPRNNYYGFESSNYLKTEVDIMSLRFEHDVNDQIMIRNQARFANYERNVLITEAQIAGGTTPATALANIKINRNQLEAVSTETYLDDQLDVVAKFPTGPVDHELVSGIEVSQEGSNPTREKFSGVPQTSLLHPSPSQTFTGTVTNTTVTEASIDTVALYAIDTVKLAEKWQLVGGIRWDHAESDFKQQTNAVVAGNAHFQRTDDMVSYRAALVFKPVKKGSFYFGYGTSFNPSAEALSLSAGTTSLPPEKNESFELGTKWDVVDERLSLSFALFRTDKNNARETSPANSLLIVEAGKQRAQGFELQAQGNITQDWSVFASYAYVDSEVLQSKFFPGSVGAPLANSPKNTFSLWTTYDILPKFEVGAGVDYVGSRDASSTVPYDATTHQLKAAPGYILGNAMAKYTFNKHTSLQLNVYNLGDNYYIDQIHPAHLVPGAGRSALLTMNYKF